MSGLRLELIHALPLSARRGYNRAEAASYVGVSVTTFDKLVSAGTMPQPNMFLGRKVWDLRALDRALDAHSGIVVAGETPDRHLDEELAAFEAKHGQA